MDMIRILQFLVLAFGLKELFNAMEYSQTEEKEMGNCLFYVWAFLPVLVQLFQ